MFKIIVAGSRTFNDYTYLKKSLDKLLVNKTSITIISGTARGADQLGERYAQENGYNLLKFPADWDKYGKSAGYKRNEEMAKVADACVVFWDGQSRGSKHMIDIAQKYNLKIRILRYQ
jgi:hypothetical protein